MYSIKKQVENAKKTSIFWAEDAKMDFIDKISTLMLEQKVSRSELARRVGTSPAYVTKVLGGHLNLSIDSMSKFAFALGLKVEFNFTPIEDRQAKQIECDVKDSSVRYLIAGLEPVADSLNFDVVDLPNMSAFAMEDLYDGYSTNSVTA